MADGPWVMDQATRRQNNDAERELAARRAKEFAERLSLPAPSDFERMDKSSAGDYYQPGKVGVEQSRRNATSNGTATSEQVLRGVLVGIIVLLLLTIIGVIVFQTAIAPGMKLEQILLDSDLPMTQDELLKSAGVANNALYYSIDPVDVEKRLAQMAMVREAHVEMRFPNAMAIKLRGREALLSSIVTLDDGSQVPVLVDSDGVAYQTGLSAAPEGLPVLSGVEFKNFYPGLSLPKFIVPFLQDLEGLKLKAPALYRGFSEFKLVPVGPQEIEVLAYAIQSSVPVRINPRLSEESALYLLRSLEVLNKTTGAGSIKEIDFRTNNVVYKSSAPAEGAN